MLQRETSSKLRNEDRELEHLSNPWHTLIKHLVSNLHLTSYKDTSLLLASQCSIFFENHLSPSFQSII